MPVVIGRLPTIGSFVRFLHGRRTGLYSIPLWIKEAPVYQRPVERPKLQDN